MYNTKAGHWVRIDVKSAKEIAEIYGRFVHNANSIAQTIKYWSINT